MWGSALVLKKSPERHGSSQEVRVHAFIVNICFYERQIVKELKN